MRDSVKKEYYQWHREDTAIITLTFFLMFLSFVVQATAQPAILQEKSHSLITYPYSDPDPVAAPKNIYPYFRFDGYTSEGHIQDWKMVEMENPYIKLYITPEIGGKIWGGIEKSTGREFIYFNHVVKFRDVAMRGAWTSGGIEFNFGLIGHAPSCATPVDYLVRQNSDSSLSCFIGSTDLPSGTRWRVEIKLPPDKAFFTTRSFWYNPTSLEQSYYHWSNAAIKVTGNLEYVFPGRYYLGHDGSYHSWPVDQEGHDLSFYENNNFGGYKSYHVFGEYTDFFGAYWHTDNFGTGHYVAYDEKPGKKLWIWGLSRQGMIWEDLLTDTDGQYSEIQSGRLFNQEVSSSSLTPFKHRSFLPGGTDTWTEYWFPVKGTEGLKYGTPDGAINLKIDENMVRLWFCPLQATAEKLRLLQNDTLIWEKQLSLLPLQVFADSICFNGNADKLKIVLGKNNVLYDTNRDSFKLSRPITMPADFDWNSLYGLFLQGKEWERQREWNEANKCFLKCLEKDPNFLPALTALASLSIRKMEFEKALEFASRALSIDTYDPAANFVYGVANAHLNRWVDALDGFSIAASSQEYRAASWVEISKIYLVQKQNGQSRKYALKALEANPLSVPAAELLVTIARLDGNQQEAEQALAQLEALDPLDHLIRYEQYLLSPSPEAAKAFTSMIRTELPHQVFLELAVWYYHLGLLNDVASLLDLAPDHPEILYWQAWLAYTSNNKQKSAEFLKKANAKDPYLVFPFLPESVEPLTWAMENSTSWKPAYYLGLIYWSRNKTDLAKSLFQRCGDIPDYYPFYLSRVKLFEATNPVETEKDLLKAISLAPHAWRVGLHLSQFYEKKGERARAIQVASSFFRKSPQNYYLGLNLARQFVLNEEYEACSELLEKLKVLPNEGATEGRQLWRESNLQLAMQAYKKKKYKHALKYIESSRLWPENLGVGKPYDVDERLADFLGSLCYQALGETQKVSELEDAIISVTEVPGYEPTGSIDFLCVWLLRKQGEEIKATQLVRSLLEKNPRTKSARWVEAMYNENKILANEIMNEPEPITENRLFSEAPTDEDLRLMFRLSEIFDF